MPVYRIKGIDRESGETRRLSVEARTRNKAAKSAQDSGVVVQSCKRRYERVATLLVSALVTLALAAGAFFAWDLVVNSSPSSKNQAGLSNLPRLKALVETEAPLQALEHRTQVLAALGGEEIKSQTPKEYRSALVSGPFFASKNKEDFTSALRALDRHGWLLSTPPTLPIKPCRHDGSLALLAVVADEVQYNTLQTDQRGRAGKTIQDVAFPAMKGIIRQFNSDDVVHFGITVTVCAYDFTETHSTSGRAEAVTVVAEASLWKKVADAQISESDFLSEAVIYLTDEQNQGLRKVEIDLR